MPRREFLRAGALGGGLGLAHLLQSCAQASPESAGRGFGRAKNCIILFLYGSPSQLETFDMKPAAPVEIRGTMQPIVSSLPGLDVCEHLPFPFSSKRSAQPARAGPYAAFLGGAYHPVWTEFHGDGTKNIHKDHGGGFSYIGTDPYLGCTDNTHFEIGATRLLTGMTVDRLSRRRSLHRQIGDARRDLDRSLTIPACRISCCRHLIERSRGC